MIPRLFKRQGNQRLVLEFNPYQILAARVTRHRGGEAVLDAAAEFDRDDAAGYRQWIEANFDRGNSWMPAVCSLVPRRGLMQRESLPPRRLASAQYLARMVERQQEYRSHSATPFRIATPEAWTLRAVSAIDGAPIQPNGSARPALLCGMATEEIQRLQQRLVDQRLMPERLEPGLLSLFGVLREIIERQGQPRAVVVAVIHQTATAVYILGKEGVHTPSPVLQGFASILELAKKELGTRDDAETIQRLQNPDRQLLGLATKFVRPIGRHLKPVVDSYEMTTGQPVDEIFCAYAPPGLTWMAEPLVRATGRTLMHIDIKDWLGRTGLQMAPGVPGFGSHWLGALGTAATLTAPTGRSEPRRREDPETHQPWHVDCRLITELATHKLAGLRLLNGVIAAALLVFVAAIMAWQLYARESVRADMAYWEQQLADNRRLFDDLTTMSVNRKEQSKRLADAYGLMGMPYEFTDLVLDLGRTIPPHMRLERIETQTDRVILAGILHEPAEVASETLGRYMEVLRRDDAIGARFSSIAITSLQRSSTAADAVVFEITLRVNRPAS